MTTTHLEWNPELKVIRGVDQDDDERAMHFLQDDWMRHLRRLVVARTREMQGAHVSAEARRRFLLLRLR